MTGASAPSGLPDHENESEVVAELDAAKPAAIVLWRRPMGEYDRGLFGKEYGRKVLAWIDDHYVPVPVEAGRRTTRIRRSSSTRRAEVRPDGRLPYTESMTSVRAFSRDVCVIGGGGHVGLPLALTFADSGLKTLIYDTNAGTVERSAAA